MQNILMKFDPATGKERPYPSHAAQWRNWHGVAAWLFDPWTGKRRNAYDVGSDVHGLLIVPAGTLGGDTGYGASKQNKHETGNDAQRPPTPTKRELFAAMAMQGYLASVGVVGGPVPRDEDIARYSVDTADALLAALEETK